MTPEPTSIQASERLGSLTHVQLQAALRRFELGTLLDAAHVHGGMGQCVFLTSTTGSYVLRGSPHNDLQLQLERFIARTLHERTTVRSAWPYLIETDASLFGWPYAIMPRLPGLNPSRAEVSNLFTEQDHLAIAKDMGATIAKAAAATFPHTGHYDLACDGIAPHPGGYATWTREHLRQQIHDALARAGAEIHTQPDMPWLESMLIPAQAAVERPFTPTLCTSDFTLQNLTVAQDAAGWHVHGVYDYFEWYVGDPERSLARSLRGYAQKEPARARAFLDGYTAFLPLRPGARERLWMYALSDLLIFWNYGHSMASWYPPELTVRAYITPELESIDRVLMQYLQSA